MDFDIEKPLSDQIGAKRDFHRDDECECGAPLDMWQTLQHDGSEYYWYSEWICSRTAEKIEDRCEDFEDYESAINP